MTAPKRYWEDYTVGESYELGRKTFTEQEIVEFARAFDPQPFHVDAEAAKQSMFGGIIASGWHTGSSMMRLLVDNFLHPEVSLGSPGLDELRWPNPVRPGDTVVFSSHVHDKRPSSSKPWMGSVTYQTTATNQKGEIVMSVKAIGLMRRRPT